MQKNLARFGFIIPLIAAGSFLVATSAFAAGPWYVDPSGTGTDCLSPATACTTIQAAVDLASPGETINVAAGTYAEHVTIDKSLTLNGANSGIACRATRSDESIISGDAGNTGAVAITADDVTLNGFQITDPDNALGSGIWTSDGGSVKGFTVKNNLITGNQIGMAANTNGASLISCNIFDANNADGSAGGTGIYSANTDHLTVDNNEFKNHTVNHPINFAATGVSVHKNLTVSNNTFSGTNSFGIRVMGVDIGAFTGNDIDTDDATGIVIDTGNSHLTITGNIIHDGWHGVRVRDDAGYPLSSDIHINRNSITGNIDSGVDFPGYGVGNESGYDGSLDATCNWWGAANGPGSVGFGFGDKVTIDVMFTSWLTTSNLVEDPCDGTPAASSNVHIFKYVDGALATSEGVGGVSFPMYTATYSAPFTLGPSGWTAGDVAYEASTGVNTAPFSYSAQEVVDTEMVGLSLVGISCDGGTHPYAFDGYTTGSTLAEAEAGTKTTNIPSFTNLHSDAYIIVWNHSCENFTPPVFLKVHVLKYLDGVMATDASASGYDFPMTATWSAANIGSGTGSYVLGTYFGGAADQYGADTSSMSAPADYTTSEITSDIDSSSEVLPVGAACIKDKYRLLGYKSSSVDFADAATMPLTTSAPVFIGLSSDRYVIVLDEKCTYTDEMNGQIRAFKEYTKDPSHHPRLAGWTIYLDMNDNNVLDGGDVASTTNAGGRAIFKGLAAGTYHVREEMPDGWNQLTPGAGADNEYSVTISAGEKSDWYRFTNYQPNSISGKKCNATEHPNPNGAKCKAGDPGLSGWTVELHKLTATTTPVTVGNLIATTVTDGSGMYNFGGLATGYYAIREVAQPGWILLHVPTVVHLGSNENATKDLRNKSVPIED